MNKQVKTSLRENNWTNMAKIHAAAIRDPQQSQVDSVHWAPLYVLVVEQVQADQRAWMGQAGTWS